MSYQPPHRRNKNPHNPPTISTKCKAKQQLKLADNEELLSDGRILIHGTLRNDGSRRPDRYKKAGFYNDEDLQRSKYIPRAAKQREEQKEKQKHKQVIINYVEALVANIINNPPKPVNKNDKNLNINFNENVLKPLLSEFYDNNQLLLKRDITNYFIQHRNKCQQLFENNLLRTEIIKFIHKLLFDKRNLLKLNANNNNVDGEFIVRGKGNFSYGSGVMLSEEMRMERKKIDKQEDDKKKRNKIRKLNEKYKDITTLEQRQTNGEILNGEQIVEINTKQNVLDKLAALNINYE